MSALYWTTLRNVGSMLTDLLINLIIKKLIYSCFLNVFFFLRCNANSLLKSNFQVSSVSPKQHKCWLLHDVDSITELIRLSYCMLLL